MTISTEAQTSLGTDKAEETFRHPLTGISVLVVGAGPVGLYTALECWRKGHHVIGVLDRSPGPNPVLVMLCFLLRTVMRL